MSQDTGLEHTPTPSRAMPEEHMTGDSSAEGQMCRLRVESRKAL